MGTESQPSTDPQVVAPAMTPDQARVISAGQRSADALARTIASVGRIEQIKAIMLATYEATPAASPVERDQRLAATALVNHQLELARRKVEKATGWDKKCQKRVAKYQSAGSYESLVKAIRYAHIVEKNAHLAERQAYWAEYYSIDQNQEHLIDTDGLDEANEK